MTEFVVTIWVRFILISWVLLTTFDAVSAQCAAESGVRRVALLELYTSEGCDSCPPADRWISSLPQRGLGPERVVTLGFHVDYWNYLGWNDPLAKSEYSARQRAASQRNQARVVYTPQLLLNGKDYRRGTFRDDFADRVGALNQDKPRARISLKVVAEPAGTLSVQAAAIVTDAAETGNARGYLALYENQLVNQVITGENRGKQLRHDFVVRELDGPYPADPRGSIALNHQFKLDPRWQTGNLRVAAFVQNQMTGDVLQALAAPDCRHAGSGQR